LWRAKKQFWGYPRVKHIRRVLFLSKKQANQTQLIRGVGARSKASAGRMLCLPALSDIKKVSHII
jgi:hypothetical protein